MDQSSCAVRLSAKIPREPRSPGSLIPFFTCGRSQGWRMPCWPAGLHAGPSARSHTAPLEGWKFRGMGVVVQTQVDALASGVLFTRTAEGTILVEHTPGLGDALVAGAINPGRFLLQRGGNGFRVLSAGERPVKNVENLLFSRSMLAELGRMAATLEEGLGGPQDVEWAIDHSGLLHIVQSRPITATLDGKRSAASRTASPLVGRQRQ